jgi:hypothetical protein
MMTKEECQEFLKDELLKHLRQKIFEHNNIESILNAEFTMQTDNQEYRQALLTSNPKIYQLTFTQHQFNPSNTQISFFLTPYGKEMFKFYLL